MAIFEKESAVYGRNTEDSALLENRDIDYILEKTSTLSEDEARNILLRAIDYHSDDPNFPVPTMVKIKQLVQGPKSSGLHPDIDYEVDLRLAAAVIHFHSPYPEVRAVTDPFDYPDIPVETFRAYFLGLDSRPSVYLLRSSSC